MVRERNKIKFPPPKNWIAHFHVILWLLLFLNINSPVSNISFPFYFKQHTRILGSSMDRAHSSEYTEQLRTVSVLPCKNCLIFIYKKFLWEWILSGGMTRKVIYKRLIREREKSYLNWFISCASFSEHSSMCQLNRHLTPRIWTKSHLFDIIFAIFFKLKWIGQRAKWE